MEIKSRSKLKILNLNIYAKNLLRLKRLPEKVQEDITMTTTYVAAYIFRENK